MRCQQSKCSGRISLIRGIAALSMLLAWVSAYGQHAAGGHAGGFSGGHRGGFSPAHVGGFSGEGFRGGFSAPRSSSGFSGSAPRRFGAGMPLTAPRYRYAPRRGPYAGSRPPYGAANRAGWDHRDHHRTRYRGFGFGNYPYLYATSWQFLPWDLGYPDFTDFWGTDERSYNSGTAQPNYGEMPPPAADQEPAPPPDESHRPPYVPAAPDRPATTQAPAEATLQNEPQLTLIFKDGHTQAIRNYMLTSRDLIVMDEAASGREARIPLSDLNLPATQQAARQAGLDFSPPSGKPS